MASCLQVTRYQSNPGQATAYMIGQMDIINARKYAEENLKDKFSLRDFHYQVTAIVRSMKCERERSYNVGH